MEDSRGKILAYKWFGLFLLVPTGLVVLLYLILEWQLPSRVYVPPRPARESIEERQVMIREAFGRRPAASDLVPPPGLVRFFIKLNVAQQAGKASDWADLFDADRLANEARLADLGGAIPLDPRGDNFAYRVRDALKGLALAGGIGLPEHETRILKIVSLPGRVDAIVCTRHELAQGSAPFRWWMTHRNGDWLAYDVEDVRLGQRLSDQIGYQLASMNRQAGSTSPVQMIRQLREAQTLVQSQKLAAAQELLHTLDRDSLPRGQKVVAGLIEANLALVRGQHTEVASHLQEISQLRAGVAVVDYLHACSAYQQGQYAEAIRLAKRYQDAVGIDPDASSILVSALLARKESSEARRVLEEALQQFPEAETLKQLKNRIDSP